MVSGPGSSRLAEEARSRTQETFNSTRHEWGWVPARVQDTQKDGFAPKAQSSFFQELHLAGPEGRPLLFFC